ncbi:hypothetical protein VCHE46_2325B, partial [Vibrio cholerae HE-46]
CIQKPSFAATEQY